MSSNDNIQQVQIYIFSIDFRIFFEGSPSSLMEVTEILQEVFPLPFVGDGVLVEDLGHIRE